MFRRVSGRLGAARLVLHEHVGKPTHAGVSKLQLAAMAEVLSEVTLSATERADLSNAALACEWHGQDAMAVLSAMVPPDSQVVSHRNGTPTPNDEGHGQGEEGVLIIGGACFWGCLFARFWHHWVPKSHKTEHPQKQAPPMMNTPPSPWLCPSSLGVPFLGVHFWIGLQAAAGAAIVREHYRIRDERALGRFGVGHHSSFQVAEDLGIGVFARHEVPDRTDHQVHLQLVGCIIRDRCRDPADDSAAETHLLDALQVRDQPCSQDVPGICRALVEVACRPDRFAAGFSVAVRSSIQAPGGACLAADRCADDHGI
jgi:hypothetical protein